MDRFSQLVQAEGHIYQLAIEKERRCGAHVRHLVRSAVFLDRLGPGVVRHFGVKAGHVQADGLGVLHQIGQRQMVRCAEQFKVTSTV